MLSNAADTFLIIAYCKCSWIYPAQLRMRSAGLEACSGHSGSPAHWHRAWNTARLFKLSEQVQEPWQPLIFAFYCVTDASPDRYLTLLRPR